MSLSALILLTEKIPSFLPWGLVVFLGKYLSFLIILVSLILLLKKKSKKNLLFVLLSIFSAEVLTLIISFSLRRIRPYVLFKSVPISDPLVYFSFPSSHATVLFALSVAFLFIKKKWGIVFVFSSILVCIARVLGGMHFPADILMGASIGTLFAVLFQKLMYET